MSFFFFPQTKGVSERPCCNIDLREHAILALRNLLEENAENMAVVDALQSRKHEGKA